MENTETNVNTSIIDSTKPDTFVASPDVGLTWSQGAGHLFRNYWWAPVLMAGLGGTVSGLDAAAYTKPSEKEDTSKRRKRILRSALSGAGLAGAGTSAVMGGLGGMLSVPSGESSDFASGVKSVGSTVFKNLDATFGAIGGLGGFRLASKHAPKIKTFEEIASSGADFLSQQITNRLKDVTKKLESFGKDNSKLTPSQRQTKFHWSREKRNMEDALDLVARTANGSSPVLNTRNINSVDLMMATGRRDATPLEIKEFEDAVRKLKARKLEYWQDSGRSRLSREAANGRGKAFVLRRLVQALGLGAGSAIGAGVGNAANYMSGNNSNVTEVE